MAMIVVADTVAEAAAADLRGLGYNAAVADGVSVAGKVAVVSMPEIDPTWMVDYSPLALMLESAGALGVIMLADGQTLTAEEVADTIERIRALEVPNA